VSSFTQRKSEAIQGSRKESAVYGCFGRLGVTPDLVSDLDLMELQQLVGCMYGKPKYNEMNKLQQCFPNWGLRTPGGP